MTKQLTTAEYDRLMKLDKKDQKSKSDFRFREKKKRMIVVKAIDKGITVTDAEVYAALKAIDAKK